MSTFGVIHILCFIIAMPILHDREGSTILMYVAGGQVLFLTLFALTKIVVVGRMKPDAYY